jgi:hypothetical protein
VVGLRRSGRGVCFTCKQPGQYRRDCPKKNKQQSFNYELGSIDYSGSPVIVEVLIEGQKARMMADTGASVSTISHRLYNALGLRHGESAVVQVGGNGKVRTTRVKEIGIRCPKHNVCVKVRPLVLDLGNYDVLLGRDWLGEAKLMPNVCDGDLVPSPATTLVNNRMDRNWRNGR